MKSRQQQEVLISQCLREDNKTEAVRLLLEVIASCAKERDFKAAEAFQQRIYEISPMALNEIIRAAEIIDEEKNRAIDKEHRRIWSELYDLLNADESNAFYYSLKHAKYGPDEVIFAQGSNNPRLFLLNRGRAKLVYSINNTEIFLKVLSPGEIAGEETFFSNTVFTTTFITHGDVELSYLDVEARRHWEKEYPVLESKLQEFASKSEKVWDMLQKRQLDRRTHKRLNVYGKGTAQLLTSSGDPLGKPFYMDVCDVSRGGICFFCRIGKREAAHHLLGRRFRINYAPPQMPSAKGISQVCVIVAIRFHHFADCSVHARFENLLDDGIMDDLNRLPPPAQFLD
ncbi:MAG: cyclic nucleotide-binding domain-containing protein [Syntrophobacter sp.]